MSTLVNNCTFFPEIDWSAPPSVRPDFRTERAESLDGAMDRLGLRSDPLVRQSWEIHVEGVAERTELQLRVREALRSGRAAAPRWDRALTVSANSGTSLTVTGGEWTLSVGSFLAVPTAAGLVAREIDAAVESPAGTWTLTLDASVTAQVGMLAYPLLFGTPEIARQDSPAETLRFRITVTEPLGTGALVNSDACTPAALEADTELSFCQNSVGTDDPETCSGTNVASLSVDPWPQADDYTVQVADAATGPWSTHATGVAATLDVPRSLTAKFYRFVPQIGGTSGDPSEVAAAPATTIEGVMRAVQERYLATTDATHGHTPSPLVWPDRISDSASPGDYPADGFYTDANVATNAAVYVQAIAEAFNNPSAVGGVAWLDRYSSDDDWTGLANIAAIPPHDTSTLMVPTTVSITAFNWTAKLFELAGCCCRLEHLIFTTTEVDNNLRWGAAYLKHDDMVSEAKASVSYGSVLRTAGDAWDSDTWDGGGVGVEIPSDITGTLTGGWPFPSRPGLEVAGGWSESGYIVSWWAQKMSRRVRFLVDLAAGSVGTARLYLSITGTTELPTPVNEVGSLQPWLPLSPGTVVTSEFIAGSAPPYTDRFGEMEMFDNFHHAGPQLTGPVFVESFWELDESIVLWTRSHKRSRGHWTHYP